MHTKKPFHGWSVLKGVVTGLCVLQTAFMPILAMAADNTATGSIAGVDADLNDSNTITLTTATLGLAKLAFLADGTAVPTGTTLARGTVVKFLVYLDNTTTAPVDSVNVSDALDAAFAYQAGSIKVVSTPASGATPAVIFAAVNAAPALTDAVSGVDAAGITGSTISAGNVAGNALVTVPASRVWAMLFTVRMQ